MSADRARPRRRPGVERRCPRCGAQLRADQEWCLDCGAAVGTRIAEPRGWRVPVAIVGTLVALALVALVLALVELAGPAEQVTRRRRQTPTPPPTAGGRRRRRPARPRRAPRHAGPEHDPPATAGAEHAPHRRPTHRPLAGRQDRLDVIVRHSSATRAEAETGARELAGKGVPGVGVLNSNDFQSLGPGYCVVFAGHVREPGAADEALGADKDRAGGGLRRRIVPKQR